MIAYCPACGDREPSTTETGEECTCGAPQQWAADEVTPVEFDVQLGEYHLLTKDNGSIIFSYCMACGGRLPQSRRGGFFTTPSHSDIIELRGKLARVNTIAEVISILGPPDETQGSRTYDPRHRDVYGAPDVKQTIKYTHLSSTFDLAIQESADGQIRITIAGKPKDPAAMLPAPGLNPPE